MLNRLPGKPWRTPQRFQLDRPNQLLRRPPMLIPDPPRFNVGRNQRKLEVSATQRLLGRNSANAGLVEEVTFSQFLDWVGSAAQGDILYRGAASWSRLAAGTSGNFLKTNGAGADPAWATTGAAGDIVKLTSGTVSAASVLDIVLTSYTAYRGLLILLAGFIPVTNAVNFFTRFSTDGGSSFDATGYRYAGNGTNESATAQFGSAAANQIPLTGATTCDNTSTAATNAVIHLLKQTSTALWSRITWHTAMVGGGVANMQIGSGFRATAQDTDAIRFLYSSGNISSGDYAVFGYN